MTSPAFATASIGHPEAINRHLPLGGPEAVSWRDVIATFERRLGRPLPVVTLSPGQPLPGLPEIIGHPMAGLETYDSVIPMTADSPDVRCHSDERGRFRPRSARSSWPGRDRRRRVVARYGPLTRFAFDTHGVAFEVQADEGAASPLLVDNRS